MRFQHCERTTASPEVIWKIWTDVENWPTWDTELSAATLKGRFALHAQGTLKPQNGSTSSFEITQLDWGKSYTFTTRLPLCRLFST